MLPGNTVGDDASVDKSEQTNATCDQLPTDILNLLPVSWPGA